MINPVIIKSNHGGTKSTSPNASNYSSGGAAMVGGDYLPATAITSEVNGVEKTEYYLIDNNTKHIKSITYQIPAIVKDEEGNESIAVDESGNTIYRDYIFINENGIKVDEYKVVTEEWFYKDDSGNIHCRFNLVGDKEIAAYGMSEQGGETIISSGVTIVDNLESTDATKALSANQGRVLDEKLKELSGKTSLHKLDDVFVEPELLEDGLVLTYSLESKKWIAKKSELPSGITSEKISQWDSAYTHSTDSKIHINDEEKQNWNQAFHNISGVSNFDILSGITSDDITNWDNASDKAHEHANKDVLDSISQSDVTNWNSVYSDWNDGFYYDENGNLHARVNLIGDKEISAYGKGDSTTGGQGIITIVDNLTSTSIDSALSANQGRVLKELIDNKKVDVDLTDYYKKSEVDAIASGKSDVSHSHTWESITNKPTSFNPSEHNHAISGITNLQSSLDKKVNNTAFNSHSADTTIHITSDERKNWNVAYNNNHTHSNKTVLDSITSTKISNWDNVYANWNKAFYYDSNGYIHVKINLIGDEEVSAYGSGNSTSTGAITIIDSLTSNATDAALSANQGRILKELIDSKTVDVNLTEYYKKQEIDTLLKSYAASSHTHGISSITGLQSALDGKASSSHTHSNYSLTGHTHAISAITNLQSSLNAKADSSALTSHTSNTTVHITASERTNWNNAYKNSHTHSNKSVLDGISSSDITHWNSVYNDWLTAFYFDSDGNLKAKVNLIGEKEISAYGQGNSSSSGIITIVDNLTSTDANSALSANQGRILKSLIDSKTIDFDQSSYYKKSEIDTLLKSYASSAHTHTISNISGLQAALDAKSGSGHTHSQYSLTSHTHTWNAITGKPTSFPAAVHQHDISDVTNLQDELEHKANVSHTHAISAVTGLQSALDGKSSTSHTHHYSAITALSDVLATKSSTGHTHAWSTITNKPSVFTPSEHDHAIDDVTGLQTALNAKAAASALTSHTSNSTVHITGDERKNWNVAYKNSHSHSNKTVLDGISATKVSNWDSVYSDWSKGFYYDANGNLHAKLNLVGDGEISAYGSGSTGNSGLVTIVDNLTSTATDAALSANQGRVLKNLIDTKTIDLSNYYNKGEIDNKLSAKASSSHTHSISNITNLQTSLDDKYSASVNRTANTVLAAPSGSNGTASFRKLVAEDLPSTVRNFSDFDISYQDYSYFVVGLFCISDTYTGGVGTSQGTVYIARNAGADWVINAEYAISNYYSSSTASTTNQKVKFMLRELCIDSSFKPCTFLHNNKKYAGLVWNGASSAYKMRVLKAFAQCEPFFVRYYNTSSSSILNSEIFNSIRIDDSDIAYSSEWLFGNLRLWHGNVSANTFVGSMGSSFSYTKNGTTYSYNGSESKSLNLDTLSYLPLSGGTLGSTSASSTWLNINSSSAKLMMCAYSDGVNYIESVNASNTGNAPLTISGQGAKIGSTLNLNFNTITTRGSYTNVDSGNVNSYAPTLTGGGASGTWSINVSGYSGALYKANYITNLNSPIWGVTDGYSINYNTCDANVSNAPISLDNANLIMNIQHGKHGTSGQYGWQVAFFHLSNAPWLRAWTTGGTATWRKIVTSGNYNEFAPTLTGTGASGTWGIGITGNAATATKLKNYYSSRPTNANLSPDGSGGMVKFLATSTMTSNKPTVDGHILHFFWDTTGGWDSQLMIPNNGNASYEPQWRGQANGTWGNWISLVTSGTIGNYNAGSATKLQTARTIWGQSFNGTASISGAMTNVSSIQGNGGAISITPNGDTNNYLLTWGGANAPFLLHNYGKITFESSTGYYFNNSVGINVNGNSINGTNYKLENNATNPYLQLGGWYLQVYDTKMYVGNGRAKSISVDANGNLILPSNSRKIFFNGNVDDNQCLVYDTNCNRICVGSSVAKGFNVGSLLASSAWSDASKVPTNGIYSKGNILSSGDITAYSDRRLKSNIKPLTNRGYITPVTYEKDGKQNIGFVAQEVQSKYPELVIEDATEDKYLALNYAQYTAVLQSQIIELNQRIEELEKKLTNK